MKYIYHWLGIDIHQREDRNAWFLTVEVFWNGFISAAATFYSAYALRLGATNTEIGLLSSLPSLISLLISIPVGKFYQSRSRRFPWVVGSIGVYRVGLMFLAVIPLIHFSAITQGFIVVLTISILHIPQVIASIGFMPVLGDVVPEDRRANVIAYRSIVANLAVVIGIFFYGLWLDRASFPSNYQIMFLFTAIISQVSTYFLWKVEAPSYPPPKPQIRSKLLLPRPGKGIWSALKSTLNSQPRFVQLIVLIFVHNVGLWMISPLGILYMVRLLGATEGEIAINATVSTVAVLVGLEVFRRMINRKGNIRIIKVLSPFFGLFNIIFSFLPSMPLIYLLTSVSSTVSPGYSLSQTNLLLKTLPEEERPNYYALWTTIMTIGPFVFPNIGVMLANQFGIAPTIRLGGIMALVAASLFWIWSPREDTPQSTQTGSETVPLSE